MAEPTLDDRTLLAQSEVTTFRSSGAGGQHVNKTDSAVRLRHLPTGIVVTSQSEKSQYLNKRECLRKLRAKLQRRAYKPKKRIPTAKPRSAKEKILKEKSRRSQVKGFRRQATSDE